MNWDGSPPLGRRTCAAVAHKRSIETKFLFLFLKKKNVLAHMQNARIRGFILLSKSPTLNSGLTLDIFTWLVQVSVWAKAPGVRTAAAAAAAQLQQEAPICSALLQGLIVVSTFARAAKIWACLKWDQRHRDAFSASVWRKPAGNAPKPLVLSTSL